MRGTNRNLYSNSTSAEVLVDPNGWVSAFNSNGFTVTDGGTSGGNVKANSSNYVAWQWKAGSITTNTSGSITSTISTNATAGFSIVTYTNSAGRATHTVGHGLGVAPRMFFIKTRSATADWVVYHASLGATQAVYLNQTLAAQTSSTFFNNTAPTSTVMTLGSGLSDAGVTIVAYCWAEIAGFSRFGSYTGNGSTDGTFIYTGFRPKFVIFKDYSNAHSWIMVDSSRNTYNVAGDYLRAESSAVENATYSVANNTAVDFLSNGFKLRNAAVNSGENNGSSNYLYMAFAEHPFKNSLAR